LAAQFAVLQKLCMEPTGLTLHYHQLNAAVICGFSTFNRKVY